jgi:ABC-type transport system substrate-binding protein
MTPPRIRPSLSALVAGLAVLVFVSGLAGPLVQKKPESRPRPGGILRVKGFLTPFNPTFDPAGPSHYFICEQLYDGLVRFDDRFTPIPALAEYWTISEDGRRITFFLRKGVTFHNGRPLTAEDVKFSLERLVQGRPESVASEQFTRKVAGAEEYRQGAAEEVSGFKVLNDATFEIHWVRPFVSGLHLLGMYYSKILPKDLLESQGRGFFQRPVGTGPFKFDQWVRSPRLDVLGVRLVRNPAYFGKKPYLAALEYSPHFTEEQFEQGDVHLISVASERMLTRGYQILENETLRTGFLALSCEIPPLNGPEIRRALALALDKTRLAEACSTPASGAKVLDNFVPPRLPGFFPRALNPQYDPERARMLLDRLLPESGIKKLDLTLLLPSPRQDAHARLASELERQLKAVGIGLSTRYLKKAEDIRGVRSPYLKLLEYGMDFPDPENILVPLYHSRSIVNQLNSRYSNPRLDGLLEQSEIERSWRSGPPCSGRSRSSCSRRRPRSLSTRRSSGSPSSRGSGGPSCRPSGHVPGHQRDLAGGMRGKR